MGRDPHSLFYLWGFKLRVKDLGFLNSRLQFQQTPNPKPKATREHQLCRADHGLLTESNLPWLLLTPFRGFFVIGKGAGLGLGASLRAVLYEVWFEREFALAVASPA